MTAGGYLDLEPMLAAKDSAVKTLELRAPWTEGNGSLWVSNPEAGFRGGHWGHA